jgi:hypothetical protein
MESKEGEKARKERGDRSVVRWWQERKDKTKRERGLAWLSGSSRAITKAAVDLPYRNTPIPPYHTRTNSVCLAD